MRKYPLGVAGFCLLTALCLVAFTAVAAQAETGANWMVSGANIDATLLPPVQIVEVEKLPKTEIRHLVLLGKIAAVNFEILCTGMTLVEAVLKVNGGSLGKARFTGCVTLIGGVESKVCKPVGETKEAGVIVTKALEDLIVLHTPSGGATVPLDRIQPEEGSVILSFNTSEECAIGQLIELRGTFFAADCNGKLESENLTHLFIQGPLTKLFLNLHPEDVANVDGSVVAELVGPHKGRTWSGLPG
jgi:hypothetical protein